MVRPVGAAELNELKRPMPSDATVCRASSRRYCGVRVRFTVLEDRVFLVWADVVNAIGPGASLARLERDVLAEDPEFRKVILADPEASWSGYVRVVSLARLLQALSGSPEPGRWVKAGKSFQRWLVRLFGVCAAAKCWQLVQDAIAAGVTPMRAWALYFAAGPDLLEA